MTTYAWPESLGVVAMEWGLRRSKIQHRNPLTQSFQEVDLLGWAWLIDVTLKSRSYANSAAVEAFFNGLVGSGDRVSMHCLVRPVPAGTIPGAPVPAVAAAQFSNQLQIQCVAGETLKAGDFVSVAGQLFQVRFDAVANGAGLMAVTIANRVRATLAINEPVTWNRPTALFAVVDDTTKYAFAQGRAESPSFSLEERF